MSRLDSEALRAAAIDFLSAEPDPTGTADLVCPRGHVMVVADPKGFRAAFKQLKKIDGYRLMVINREDLFAANTLSIGSKVGIYDAAGKVLKAADLPRKI